jgi:hypothetical protein
MSTFCSQCSSHERVVYLACIIFLSLCGLALETSPTLVLAFLS